MYDLKEFKKIFDPLIQAFLDEKIKNLSKIGNKQNLEYISYIKLFLTEGKRLRPYLAFLTYKTYGGKKDNEALHLLVFLELLHAFLLVHDDIMDKADTRHNIPTAHKFIASKVKNLNGIDPEYFGISQAILLGDFLFAWAFEILTSNKDFEGEILKEIEFVISFTMDNVISGQMLDLNTTLFEKVSLEDILTKLTLKTADYSFVTPMKVGARLAGNIKNDKFFEDLGKALGIAFQTQDDLLDIKFDESSTHKSSLNDVQERQQTFFTYYIFNNGTDNDKNLLSKYFGKKLSDEDKIILRNLFEESGAIKYGEKIMNDNFEEAKKFLEEQKIDNEFKQKFLDLISLIEKRKN